MTREWVDDAKPRPKDKRWVMRCDQQLPNGRRCPTQSEPFIKQPPLQPFADLGWSIAEKYGDVCPSCLDAGRKPTTPRSRVMSA